MKTSILYIRVSTDEQAEKGYSQRYQEEVLARYCLVNGIEIQHTIFEDFSAKTFNRPAWNQILAIISKSKIHRPNLVLFTKWDRFSRNTTDAYQMIRHLNNTSIEPLAIEQPLDLNIPENKMMLAFYLAAPEVENDRRALNVVHGMRRAKKKGRWMSGAPYGYANKTTENGQRYISPIEPHASQMKWALTEIAKGIFKIKQIYREARQRGLSCGANNFYNLIRNPVYCGKIAIPAYKNEPACWVEGKHEAIINLDTFMQVQQVINNRKKNTVEKKVEIPEQLYLRGYLQCPKCGLKLSGSESTGRYKKYCYYHCKAKCGYRLR